MALNFNSPNSSLDNEYKFYKHKYLHLICVLFVLKSINICFFELYQNNMRKEIVT